MRKRSLLVMVLILCEVLAQRHLADGQDRNMGAVKTVITITKDYLFSSGKWKADGRKRHKEIYDSEGRILEDTEYSYFAGIEGISYKYEHVYDELGRVKEVRHFHSEGLILDRYIYNYDNKGRLSKIVRQQPEKSSISRAYVYDDAGRLIQETYYENGLPVDTKFTTYNSDGSVEVANQHKSDPVYHKSLTFYDAEQRPIKKLNYDSKGILEGQTQFKYDESGRLIQKSDYDAEGGLVRGEVNTYNSRGLLETWTTSDAKGAVWSKKTIEYKFDAKGEWVESQTIYYDETGKPRRREEIFRTIIYSKLK